MNRIIILGNGFDLAHDFKTSYSDFIKFLWKKKYKTVQSSRAGNLYIDDDIQISNLPKWWETEESFNSIKNSVQKDGGIISFLNSFLQKITISHSLNNWVDIENEYYQALKSITVNNSQLHLVEKLNKEFLSIQNSLVEYLKTVQFNEINKSKRNDSILQKMYADFRIKDFSESSAQNILNQEVIRIEHVLKDIAVADFLKNRLDDKTSNLIQEIENATQVREKLFNLLLSDSADSYFDLIPNEVLILNFNYTNTEEMYQTIYRKHLRGSLQIPVRIVHIHGELNSDANNPIIFGFGDELDEDYKKIENLNNNESLSFIKSIKYLEKSNYKILLEFVNSEEYQIFIMGHSCGLSDRTLLNTIFEHKNCGSIKPFYHLTNKGDNYSDIVKNISRCFNSKQLMRDRVVNKEFCISLT